MAHIEGLISYHIGFSLLDVILCISYKVREL